MRKGDAERAKGRGGWRGLGKLGGGGLGVRGNWGGGVSRGLREKKGGDFFFNH